MKPNPRQNPVPPDRRLACLTGNPNAAPRCGAKTRAGGSGCQPAMPNGRCRLHGGKSTGPRTADGIERIRAARTIHGGYGAEAMEMRDLIRGLKARARRLREMV